MKPKCKITGRGIALGGAALVMLFIGLLLADGELMTIGSCGLLLLAACRLLAPGNLKNLELRVRLPSRFFAMRSVHAELELINRGRWLNARQVRIRMRLVHQVRRQAYAACTAAGGCSSLKERISIPSRAESSGVNYELRSGFPLGLFEVRRAAEASCPSMVYPQPITPPELLWGDSQPDHHPNSGVSLGDLFGEPRGIRRYQPGDKVARIHQSASARAITRGQGLQVRAYDPPGFHPQRCRVVFHSFAKEGEIIRLDRFERALSLAAGVLAHFHINQTMVTLQADFDGWRSHPSESRSEYIDCLALLTTATRSKQTKAQELADILQHTPTDEQLIIISDSPSEQWADLVPKAHQNAMLINIREVRFKKPGIQFQPAKTA